MSQCATQQAGTQQTRFHWYLAVVYNPSGVLEPPPEAEVTEAAAVVEAADVAEVTEVAEVVEVLEDDTAKGRKSKDSSEAHRASPDTTPEVSIAAPEPDQSRIDQDDPMDGQKEGEVSFRSETPNTRRPRPSNPNRTTESEDPFDANYGEESQIVQGVADLSTDDSRPQLTDRPMSTTTLEALKQQDQDNAPLKAGIRSKYFEGSLSSGGEAAEEMLDGAKKVPVPRDFDHEIVGSKQ